MNAWARGGAALVVLYTGLIAVADAITKDLAALYAAPQLYAVSGFVVVALCMFSASMQPAHGSLRTSQPVAMAIRSGATILAALSFFLAFRFLPFAQVFLFVGLMPLVAALMAGPILKEAVSPTSWAALATGFAGITFLFPQGFTDFSWGHIAAFSATLFGTLSIVLSRYIGQFEAKPLAQVFYPNLLLFVVMAVMAPFVWRPIPATDLGWAVAYGVVLFLARWVLVSALRELAAHVVTTLMKLQFVWMVLIGAVVFGEWPAASTYFGAVIVIGSGLFLVFEDRILRAPFRA